MVNNSNEFNSEIAKLKFSLQENIYIFKNYILKDNSTIKYREFSNEYDDIDFGIIYSDEMVNTKVINEDLIASLIRFPLNKKYKDIFESVRKIGVTICDLTVTEDMNEIINSVLYGDTLLLIDGFDKAISLDTKFFDTRSISEPQGETILSGPREGFTEVISKNIALIKRKIVNKNLKCEFLKVNTQTNTKIAIMYMDGICDKNILKEVKKRLNEMEIDFLISSNKILEAIEDKPSSLFRQIGTTERPDIAAQKIMTGKVVILVDGTPIVLTVPFLFNEYFSFNEDYYNHFFIASFYRLLRYLAFLLGSSTPAIYVSIITHHKEVLPMQLYVTIFLSRSGVPFLSILECFLMLIIFEIIKEAGIRLPKYIGPSISIVGALVLGEAAVNARFASGTMVIIIAITELSSLILTYMQEALIILRFIYLILGAMFGIYGYMIGVFLTSIHLVSLRSFGKSYMGEYLKMDKEKLKDTFIRYPTKNIKGKSR